MEEEVEEDIREVSEEVNVAASSNQGWDCATPIEKCRGRYVRRYSRLHIRLMPNGMAFSLPPLEPLHNVAKGRGAVFSSDDLQGATRSPVVQRVTRWK